MYILVQSVPVYSVSKLVNIIKSVTAREIFKRCPGVKKELWGGEFCSSGYFCSSVGKHGNEEIIGEYVKQQGSKYEKLHMDYQLTMF